MGLEKLLRYGLMVSALSLFSCGSCDEEKLNPAGACQTQADFRKKEICNNGRDDNCNQLIDEGCDDDHDGYCNGLTRTSTGSN